jgi:hypothetical protein
MSPNLAPMEPELSLRARFPWRVVFLLWALAGVGMVAVVPYSLTIQAPLLAKMIAEKPMPLSVPALIALQLAQGTVMVWALTALGLFLARRIGLGAPILEGSLVGGQPLFPQLRAIAPRAVAIGAAAGIAIVLLEWVCFSAGMREELSRAGISYASLIPPAWQGLLASLYGGVDEELLTRLFLLSLLAWIGARLTGVRSGRPGPAVLWVANVLAALLFAAGHLPAVKAIGLPLDAFMIIRTLTLNSVAGLAFGWLYVSAGIEAAMISHFTADLILHVLGPILSG